MHRSFSLSLRQQGLSSSHISMGSYSSRSSRVELVEFGGLAGKLGKTISLAVPKGNGKK
jgi:hypothetical protein